MPQLDPQMQAILSRLSAAGGTSYMDMSPLEARAEQERRNAYWNEHPAPVARVVDHELDGAFGRRHLRLFDAEPEAGERPAIVYFHGGGWVIGSPKSHDVIGRGLARATGLPVLSYDYVKAPEYPFPQPIEDCVAAFRAVQARAGAFGIDSDRLGVGGDSAGAALAINVAMALRGQRPPTAVAMAYPTAAMAMDTESHKTFGSTDDYFLSSALMGWFWRHYVRDPAHQGDPRLELATAELRGLPATYISVAEFDCLRDEGDALFDKLRADGVDVEYHLWRGVTHASLAMGRDLAQAHRFIQEIGDFFKRWL